MATQNLSDLRQRVKDWSNRRDLSDELLDDFINIAQARLNRSLRIPPLEAEATILIENENDLLIPRDYLEGIQLTVETAQGVLALERKDLSFVEELASKETGTPLYFARRGNTFYLAPTPQEITEAKLYYYISFQPLVEDGDSNWFVLDAPEALLYGSLTELALYIRDETAAVQWEAKYQAKIQEIQKMADDAQWSGDTLSISLGGSV